MAQKIPTTVVTGFLGAGKTNFNSPYAPKMLKANELHLLLMNLVIWVLMGIY